MQGSLDEFLAQYGINLLSTKPYDKGSSSLAETSIQLLKEGLRQVCLADTKQWPQALPSVLSGLNAAPLHNTAVTREQLFFSPLSHVNSFNTAQSHIPELIFNTQFLRLRALKEKRNKSPKTNK